MELKYFGNIEPNNLEEYYDHQAVVAGNEIELDLNFEEEEIKLSSLEKVNDVLKSLDVLLSDAKESISKDYDLGKESETARDFLAHHMDVLDSEEIQSLFGTNDVTKELFMSKLIATRVGLYPEDEESFAIVDVTFEGEITNYLMAVTYDENNELSYISMDS